MENPKRKNSKNFQQRFYKNLKRKVFFSNELKKALLLAHYEAQKNQTCVNLNLFISEFNLILNKAYDSRI